MESNQMIKIRLILIMSTRPVCGVSMLLLIPSTQNPTLAPRRNQRRLGIIDQEPLNRLHRRHLLAQPFRAVPSAYVPLRPANIRVVPRARQRGTLRRCRYYIHNLRLYIRLHLRGGDHPAGEVGFEA